VVGTYVLSLVVGLSVPDLSNCAIANLEYTHVIHHAPVFIGDTIGARSEVIALQPSRRKPDRGIVTFHTEGYNQHNVIVITLQRKVLLPMRHAVGEKDAG